MSVHEPGDADGSKPDDYAEPNARRDPHTGEQSIIHSPAYDEGWREACARTNRRILECLGRLVEAAAAGRGGEAGDGTLFGGPGEECGNRTAPGERLSGEFLSGLKPLKVGSEAAPFHDETQGVVYKRFSVTPEGGMGWKLTARKANGVWQVDRNPANLESTAEKLALLHKAGGLATELVGLLNTGALLAKQPLAYETEPGMETRANAVAAMKGVQIAHTDFHGLRVLWVDGEPWLMGDLHAANIMRDVHGQDRVIDALVMAVPAQMIADMPEVFRAVKQAREKAEGNENDGQGQLFAL